jgi:hypothetical protein
MSINSQAEICRHIGAIKEKYRHSLDKRESLFPRGEAAQIGRLRRKDEVIPAYQGNDGVLFSNGILSLPAPMPRLRIA